MTTFAAHARRGRMAVMYYARISGIPFVFADHRLPAKWDEAQWTTARRGQVVVAGDYYTWSTTLDANTRYRVKAQIEPKSGRPTAGSMKIRMRRRGTHTLPADDLWLWLLNHAPAVAGEARAVLQESLPPGVTGPTAFLTADTSDGWPNTGQPRPMYAGLETLTYQTTADGVFETLTRGRWGSPALYHDATLGDALEAGGGTILSTNPRRWVGRILRLWMATGGIDEQGEFTPFGDSLESPHDLPVYTGVIVNHIWSDDYLSVELDTRALPILTDAEIGTRLPRRSIGRTKKINAVDVLPDCDRIRAGFFLPPVDTHAEFSRMRSARISTELSGAIGYDRGPAQLEEMIRYFLFDWEPLSVAPVFGATGVRTSIVAKVAADHRWQIFVNATNLPAVPSDDAWIVIDATDADSFWRCLGFTGFHQVQATVNTDTKSWQWALTADRALAYFHMPARPAPSGGRGIPTTAWIASSSSAWDKRGGDFAYSPGWVTDDGQPIGAYARIGDEIVRLSGTIDTDVQRRVVVAERAQLGSSLREHYIEYNPDDQDTVECVQGIALPGCSVWRAWLYLVLGGSGSPASNHAAYDQGWWQSGLAVPADLVAVDEIEALSELLQQVGGQRNNLAVFEPTKLGDLLAGDFLVTQSTPVPERTSTGYRLTARAVLPALEADLGDAVIVIDDTNSVSFGRGRAALDTSETRVINVIQLEANYDNATGQYGHLVTMRDAQSIATYGERPALTVQLRSIRSKSVDQLAAVMAARIFSNFARPYAVIEKALRGLEWWTTPLMGIVLITDPRMPTLPRGDAEVVTGRGITTLPACVWARDDAFPVFPERGAIRGTATLIASGGNGRLTRWAPSARCTSRTAGTLTLAAHAFSHASDPADGLRFRPGWRVRLRAPGVAGTETHTVSTLSEDGLTMVLLATPSVSPPFLVEFASYDDSDLDPEQRRWLAMSHGNRKLDRPGGADLAFTWL